MSALWRSRLNCRVSMIAGMRVPSGGALVDGDRVDDDPLGVGVAGDQPADLGDQLGGVPC